MKVKIKEKVTAVKLELSEREAVALTALLAGIAGWVDSDDNPRAIIGDKLWNELNDLGFGEDHKDYDSIRELITTSAYVGER